MSNSMNRVHATLGKDAVNNILNELKRLETQMPMLQNLNNRERNQILPLGDGNLSFVQDAVEMMQRHPDMLPGFVSTEEVAADFELYRELDQISDVLAALQQKITDTRRLAGAEAMQGALIFYRSVRSAANLGVSHSKALYDALKARFEGQGNFSKAPDEETAEAVPEDPA